jgi:hypothetical protein
LGKASRETGLGCAEDKRRKLIRDLIAAPKKNPAIPQPIFLDRQSN